MILEQLISLVVIIWIIHFVEKKFFNREKEPRTYIDYLKKLQRITGMSVGDIFRIAADETGFRFNDLKIMDDLKEYDRTEGKLPHYVIRFLDKGKPHIDSFF